MLSGEAGTMERSGAGDAGVDAASLPEPPEYIRRLRKSRRVPALLRGKPWRRIQREIYQRVYSYPHRNLLAVGQAKSGSTWLFRMMKEVPGYLPWTPPNVKTWTDHHLERSHFVPPPAGYTVTKTHTPPTEANVSVIHETGRPYVVLLRDPRDLAVSWAYYVVNKEDCRYHEEAGGLAIEDRLTFYIERVLPKWIGWGIGWKARAHPERGLVIRYEDMKADCLGVMRRVFAHYEVGLGEAEVASIVEAHSFRRATGRDPGQADAKQFNRKGIVGDWKNHFTEAHREAFKRVGGDALIELGYEPSRAW